MLRAEPPSISVRSAKLTRPVVTDDLGTAILAFVPDPLHLCALLLGEQGLEFIKYESPNLFSTLNGSSPYHHTSHKTSPFIVEPTLSSRSMVSNVHCLYIATSPRNGTSLA